MFLFKLCIVIAVPALATLLLWHRHGAYLLKAVCPPRLDGTSETEARNDRYWKFALPGAVVTLFSLVATATSVDWSTVAWTFLIILAVSSVYATELHHMASKLASQDQYSEKAREQHRKEMHQQAIRLRELRDSDVHSEAVYYEIRGRHPLETLAMRYGIAHLERGQDGKMRESNSIMLRKVEPLGSDRFRVTLPGYRDREVIAVIQKGEDFVRTFYPSDPDWFQKNAEWEAVIKGNSTWSLKDIAKMHVDRINSRISG